MKYHANNTAQALDLTYHEDFPCSCPGLTFNEYTDFLVWYSAQKNKGLTRVQHQLAASIIGWGWGTGTSKRNRRKSVSTYNKHTHQFKDYKAEEIAAHDWLYEAVEVNPGDIETLLGDEVDGPTFRLFQGSNLIDRKISDDELGAFISGGLVNHVVASALRTKGFIDHLEFFNKVVFDCISRRGGVVPDAKSATLLKLADLMNRTKKNLIIRMSKEKWHAEYIRSHRGRFIVSDNPILLLNSSGRLLPPWAFEVCAAIYIPIHSGMYVVLRKSTFRPKIDQEVLNQMQAFQGQEWVIGSLGKKIKPFSSDKNSDKNAWATITTATGSFGTFQLRYVPDWPRDDEGYLNLSDNMEVYSEYFKFADKDIYNFVTAMYGKKVKFW